MAYRFYRFLTELLFWLLSPWRAWTAVGGSREWRERLGGLPRDAAGGVWVHVASVGEVRASIPLVRALSGMDLPVMLTVVTRTGRDVAERALAGDATIAHAPLDFPRAVREALERLRPLAVLLVETELWPNLVVEAKRSGAAVAVVNGRLSESGLRRSQAPFSPVGVAAAGLDAALCQTDGDRQRFVRLGVAEDSAVVVGNMKFDTSAAPPGPRDREALRTDLGLATSSRAIVFGSVRPDEEASVAAAAARIAAAVSEARFVVAPRHLERVRPIAELLADRGIGVTLRSEGRLERDGDALLLDTTGELAAVYGAAEVAFVGGTLAPYGGHNPLEPAAVGTPVLLGPHTESCAEAARLLIGHGGAVRVADAAELTAAAVELLTDEPRRSEVARSALEAVREGAGATVRTIALLEDRLCLGPPAGPRRERGGTS